MGLTRDRLRNLLLVFLVLLSFFLSYKLWTAGRSLGEESTSGQITRINPSIENHRASDVFGPSKLALHNVEGPDTLRMSHTEKLKDLWAVEFNNENLEQVVWTESMNYEEYANFLQSSSWLELVYAEELPIGILEQKFSELSRETANEFYNRVLVNIDNQDFIYFYNTGTERLYAISVTEEAEPDLEPYLNSENLDYVEATMIILENNIVYLPSEPLSIPYKSYVVDQLANSVYINSFFPDTSLVSVRSSGSLTRYIDLTKEVSINDNTDTLNYLRQISNVGELDPATRYIRSFEQVNRFENWGDTFILSDYNRLDQSLTFRREIDGFPVFSPFDYDSASKISIVESGVTQLKLPLRFIQTPIDIPDSNEGGSAKELIAGPDLVEELQNNVSAEIFAQIENVTIGYRWIQSEENNQVVDFTPEWHVLYDGTWMTYLEFLKMHEGVTYGF